jgi:hypothetical protein
MGVARLCGCRENPVEGGGIEWCECDAAGVRAAGAGNSGV